MSNENVDRKEETNKIKNEKQILNDMLPFKKTDIFGNQSAQINLLDFHQLDKQPDRFFEDLDINVISKINRVDPVTKYQIPTINLEKQILNEKMQDNIVKYMTIPSNSELPEPLQLKKKRQVCIDDSSFNPSDDDDLNDDLTHSLDQSEMIVPIQLDLAPIVRKAAKCSHSHVFLKSHRRQEISKSLQQVEYIDDINENVSIVDLQKDQDDNKSDQDGQVLTYYNHQDKGSDLVSTQLNDQKNKQKIFRHPFEIQPQQDLYMILGMNNFPSSLKQKDTQIPTEITDKIIKYADKLNRKVTEIEFYEAFDDSSISATEHNQYQSQNNIKGDVLQMLKFSSHQESNKLLSKLKRESESGFNTPN